MKKHSNDIQIRFSDTDLLGHVNNANYLTYFELARLSFFENAFEGTIDWTKEGILIANANIDFNRPILLTDRITIKTWVSRIGNKSFQFKHQIIDEMKGIVFSESEITVVMVSYQTGQTIAIPSDWRATLEEYLQNQA